ncbi:GNAT family N-acetyltransferase [Rhodococcus sp. G-MC3]|uniref:GNAT family N-acetyltransferase n=1 Tax=Rhodococcus sp. G-MC3 TaxID=3046209 RepID=UPI0024BAA62E|nr:GNAT family N-acetyltransferase [Rhodococcus sp. G-MC3]MDJ0395777.1 GNAT family N-acetyltransferase [Rhodococcus sp. G-MC3]
MEIRVEHQAEHHRFVLFVGLTEAAFSEYFDADTKRNFYHTVTLPQYRGRGLAAVLTEYALDDTRARGMTVVPACWFVNEFIETNAEKYANLLTSAESPGAR